MAKTRVVVVDDSALVRGILAQIINAQPDLETVGAAPDPIAAREMIRALDPDVITLDVEMPRMDGITFLRRLMEHYPLPVIIVSSVTQAGSAASIEALRAGAIDVIPKPGGPHAVGQLGERLKQRIRGLRSGGFHVQKIATAPPVARPATPVPAGRKAHGLIAIGASTGGTQAIEAVLTRLPAETPPIVIVQHMPANFTRAFAERLDSLTAVRVIEAKGNEVLERSTAYVAPGDFHMTVERFGVQLRTALRQGPPVHHQRPAVDVLFYSVARLTGLPTVALLLTGMGADGADGMVALREAGAETIAEDEASCVVFGMPKEAIARGGAAHVATLLRMPSLVFECFDRLASRRVA